MRVAVREVQEEGILGLLANPARRALGQLDGEFAVVVQGTLPAGEEVPRREAHALQVRRAADPAVVPVQSQGRVGAQTDHAAVLDEHVRLLPDMRDAEVIVEPDFERPWRDHSVVVDSGLRPILLAGSTVAEMPLSDERGSVACRPEQHGQRVTTLLDQQGVIRPDVGRASPGAPTVPARHQPVPGGRADRVRRVSVGEPTALLGDAVDVRGLVVPRPVRAQVAVAQVISQDEDDIPRGGSGDGPPGRAEDKQRDRGESATGGAQQGMHGDMPSADVTCSARPPPRLGDPIIDRRIGGRPGLLALCLMRRDHLDGQ